MADFARINPDNGSFEIAPVNFEAPDGTTIMNFYLDENMMSEYGFKPVDSDPEPEVQSNQVAAPIYEDLGDTIRVTWRIVDIEDPVVEE